jgi:transposase
MEQNFLDCDREQAFLMPPSLRDWLPEDHLAWFVIETVGGLDLGAFYSAYRADGHGRAAYDPAMVVSLLTYAYSTGEYSSRGIERHCRQDIAYRVITANHVPDHATVARFMRRHQGPLAGLFTQVLELCGKAGLVRSGVVAIDGTKLRGSASRDVNVDYGQIAKEIIETAIHTDETEDEEHGDDRGDELPLELSTDEGRRAWLARELAAQHEAGSDADQELQPESGYEFDAEKIVARVQGRDGWLLDAKRQLDQNRWLDPAPIHRSRDQRLRAAGRRLEEDLDAKRLANEAYEHYRDTAIDGLGRKLSRYRLKPYELPETPDGTVNLTDPDARLMMGHKMFVQGYNAQAVVTEDQIVVAAEITTEPTDFGQLAPMIAATDRELQTAQITGAPQAVVADAGYWNERTMDELAIRGVAVLIPPDSGKRKGNRTDQRPGWDGGRYSWMRALLSSDLGGELYRKRKQSIEPVFGHTKHNRKFTQFHRRGRGLVRTEWRLLMMTHNLGKLHRHQLATARP